MKTLLTAIIAVAMLSVVGQTSAFEIAIEIIHMEAVEAGGSGENIHREDAYPYDWASGNSDECLQLNINGGPGLTQLYPSPTSSDTRTQHYVINRDPGFHLLAGRCHGGTNFTVLADGAILIGVPQVAATGPSEVLIDVWDNPDNEVWVLVKATNLDGAGGGGGAGPAGAQGPQGKQGAAGADGAAGSAGDTGSAGAQGPQGDAGADGADGATGADAPCKPCADVTNAAVALACEILGETPPTNFADLQDSSQVIVDTLLISANICEDDCDVNAGIQAAIDAKLSE